MTDPELVQLGLYVHGSVLVASIPVVIAVFGYKFVIPMIERAEDVCAKKRGRLTTELVNHLKPFVEPPERPELAEIVIIDAKTEQPFERAAIREVPKLDSERFRDAVGRFLDDESRDFDDYWLAYECKYKLLRTWNLMRIATGWWPVCGLVAVAVFGAWAKELLPVVSRLWLFVVGISLLLPLVAFSLCIPFLSAHGNRLERLRK